MEQLYRDSGELPRFENFRNVEMTRWPGAKATNAFSRFSVLGDELQRDAIVAPAFSGWLRAVVENVAVVAGATGTVILGARQDELEIRAGAEYSGNGREKARPAGAALVFHGGRE
jgi:hypothetical protein